MKRRIGLALALGLALGLGLGCGGSTTAVQDQGSAAPKDTRTAIERRRDTACEQLGPALTACAVADAKADLASGKITQAQFDKDASPDVQRGLTKQWLDKCEVPMSSRQVRVLEVCYREEQDCDPLTQCLQNLQPKSN
jgi:hypothetical protein